MKSDRMLGRNFPKGVVGDMQNVILTGAGRNMRKVLASLRALLHPPMGESRKFIQSLIAILEGGSAHQQVFNTP